MNNVVDRLSIFSISLSLFLFLVRLYFINNIILDGCLMGDNFREKLRGVK